MFPPPLWVSGCTTNQDKIASQQEGEVWFIRSHWTCKLHLAITKVIAVGNAQLDTSRMVQLIEKNVISAMVCGTFIHAGRMPPRIVLIDVSPGAFASGRGAQKNSFHRVTQPICGG